MVPVNEVVPKLIVTAPPPVKNPTPAKISPPELIVDREAPAVLVAGFAPAPPPIHPLPLVQSLTHILLLVKSIANPITSPAEIFGDID